MLMAIDPSLNEAGICIFDDENRLLYTCTINNPEKLTGMKRLSYIKKNLIYIIKKYKIDYVGIEDYSYGSKGQAIINLGELGGIIRLYLYEHKIIFKVISPTTIKKFITNKGNSKKELMLLKVYKKYGIEFENNNICDAYALGKYIIEKGMIENEKE